MANAIVGDLNCPSKLAPRACCFRVMGTKLMNLHFSTPKGKSHFAENVGANALPLVGMEA